MEKLRSFAKTVKEMIPVFELLIVLATVVTITVMIYGNLGNRLDAIDTRLDAMQAENNRRLDTVQAENNRRHDELLEVLRASEGRLSRLEGRASGE
jgi:hypothetical protein